MIVQRVCGCRSHVSTGLYEVEVRVLVLHFSLPWVESGLWVVEEGLLLTGTILQVAGAQIL